MKTMFIIPSLFSLCACLLLAQAVWACAENKLEKVLPANKVEPVKDQAKAKDEVSKQLNTAADNNQQVSVTVLKKRLRKTRAIGFFTKLVLRNDLLDLMRDIKKYRKKSILNDKMSEVRASFDGLLLKIITLLDKDPNLSRDLYVGREMIWQSLLEKRT